MTKLTNPMSLYYIALSQESSPQIKLVSGRIGRTDIEGIVEMMEENTWKRIRYSDRWTHDNAQVRGEREYPWERRDGHWTMTPYYYLGAGLDYHIKSRVIHIQYGCMYT